MSTEEYKPASQEEMNAELIPLVDENDHIIGSAAKMEAHYFNSEHEKSKLHRAFSVLLFDSNGKLLVQRRSAEKLTFPLLWANTCCSHPLFSIPQECGPNPAEGVKRAAIRRMKFELGVPTDFLKLEDYHLVGRMRYYSPSFSITVDEKKVNLAENEIDYILIAQTKVPIPLNINKDEIAEVRYISREELPAFLEKEPISPWFRHICNSMLPAVWSEYIDEGKGCKEWTEPTDLPEIKEM
ncbi:putative isopentenyl-diphosphate delta-isomerase [Monocercomonoides exilis]|uniref:putative isopentenyl-diphosphate delta-isomerase n=1 Tax=Monocercomonoides exilis TaxID=2049356 RepID=UPI0035594B33|nr:putative isopentenyl-diphosphate delta-isomerase [Monocercomonoides exilis]|eukprot:MONOS_854.1-p1 / transcript=MONOS_854.1 / gene=MONOS_854 / organism=Monocercomonoides_exilis_PA203 / gene_product=isopentenyl-diphosphate delta-isomerase / transcript_product=isopentenyl-diphosphate delta-isomerase / location=Mono_scaffold00014:92716-93690(-) / protein_length=239 / sequence_SO=supercontig / SO=protein_coding / is_pseudo=false